MFVGDLKRPGWPRQIVLFHVPAGGSDLLHVGVAAVRAYRCCRDPGATGAWSRSGVLRLRDCLWEDSGLPSRGNGVLVTRVFGRQVPREGRSVPSGVEDSRLEPDWFWRLGLVVCSLFCSETVCVFCFFLFSIVFMY